MRANRLTRREFLRVSGYGLGAAVLTACGVQATEEPTAVPTQAESTKGSTALTEPRVIVGDVLDFGFDGDWPGEFGFVRFNLHAGYYNGERSYYIRTDASDKAYADEHQLVFVPLLIAGKNVPGVASKLYLFEGGAADQLPVMSTDPSQEDYSPIWQLHQVTPNDSTVYESETSLLDAVSQGAVTIEPQDIFVNFPVVKWVSGEMAVDTERETYLGTGQLLEPVDTENMTVTFKLHQCFPGSRYIVTDTSAAPMAPMMSISPASPIQKLLENNAAGTARIWVFANGIPGSGVMGFQPAIFDSQAQTDPIWSPLWNHFTLRWKDDATPRVLTTKEDVAAALAAGEVDEFNGTPDTHPNGFIVNCPVPVLAPNTFTG